MSVRHTILHVGKFYPPVSGGMERVVQLLCENERAHEGLDSRVLVANQTHRTVDEQVNGVPVTRVAAFGAIGSVGLCPTFPVTLARTHRDVTVIHEPNPLALVSDYLARPQGPLVVWFHSEVLRPQWKYRLMYRPFLQRVLSRASRIIVSSPNLAAHAVELQPFRDKCVVIPFGIDTDRFVVTPSLARHADILRALTPGPRVLFVGRMVPYKGVDVLLRALALVNITAWLVGDGPSRFELEAQARWSGVANRVHFLGSVSDEELVTRLHACDFLVLPSVTHAETFGMVQLEAMACGKPVISTNVRSGVPWVNRHGETGLVVQPGDAKALAAAIDQLAVDEALRRRMGEAGRRRVLEDFAPATMAARTAALYREVIASGPRTDWNPSAAELERPE